MKLKFVFKNLDLVPEFAKNNSVFGQTHKKSTKKYNDDWTSISFRNSFASHQNIYIFLQIEFYRTFCTDKQFMTASFTINMF
jgi:hypothetical protein